VYENKKQNSAGVKNEIVINGKKYSNISSGNFTISNNKIYITNMENEKLKVNIEDYYVILRDLIKENDIIDKIETSKKSRDFLYNEFENIQKDIQKYKSIKYVVTKTENVEKHQGKKL